MIQLLYITTHFVNFGRQLYWRDDTLTHSLGVNLIKHHGDPTRFGALSSENKLVVTLVACALYPASKDHILQLNTVRTQGILWYLTEHYWSPGADTRYADRFIETLHKTTRDHVRTFIGRGSLRPAERPVNFDKLATKWSESVKEKTTAS